MSECNAAGNSLAKAVWPCGLCLGLGPQRIGSTGKAGNLNDHSFEGPHRGQSEYLHQNSSAPSRMEVKHLSGQLMHEWHHMLQNHPLEGLAGQQNTLGGKGQALDGTNMGFLASPLRSQSF